jgi:hypothetical protein
MAIGAKMAWIDMQTYSPMEQNIYDRNEPIHLQPTNSPQRHQKHTLGKTKVFKQ